MGFLDLVCRGKKLLKGREWPYMSIKSYTLDLFRSTLTNFYKILFPSFT